MVARSQLEQMLTPGDMRSAGRSAAAATLVAVGEADPEDLVRIAASASPEVRMRAMDALEKASRRDHRVLAGLAPDLLALAGATSQKEVRWHLAQLIPRCKLNPVQRIRGMELLRSFLDDSSSIVKTWALDGIVRLARSNPRRRQEARVLLDWALKHGTPAMKARARSLLSE